MPPATACCKAAAARLQATVGASDTVARLGGDEFTVVLEDVGQPGRRSKRMAREILTAFSTPLDVDERHDVSITPSLGISLYPDHALVPTDLLKFADTAMYQAKAEGRNTYQIYNETMDAEARQRAAIICARCARRSSAASSAWCTSRACRWRDGSITGVEALLRWNSAELGEIAPTVVHPAGRGERPDPVDRRMGAARGLPTAARRWRAHGLTEICDRRSTCRCCSCCAATWPATCNACWTRPACRPTASNWS